MVNISKLNNLSIDDLASLWGVEKADIAKVIELDIGVTSDLFARSPTIFSSWNTEYTSITKMDSTHAIVAYRDIGEDNRGKAVCLTLSGTTITAESPITFNSGSTRSISITKMNNTHTIVAYQDDNDNGKGKVVCLTLSGTTITIKAPITFESEAISSTSISSIDETHAVVAYRIYGDSGNAVCITFS